jgi:hypothetical protein
VQSDGKRIREAELVGTRASYMHVLACSVTCYLDDRIKHKPHILSAPREVHDRKKISIHLSQKHSASGGCRQIITGEIDNDA